MRGELRGEARGEIRDAGELGRAAGCRPDDAEGLGLPAESCAGTGEWPLPLVEARARCCRDGRCSCLKAATATAALAAAAAACAAAAAAGPLAGGERRRPECRGCDGADVISESREPGLRSRIERSQGPALGAVEGAAALDAFPGMTETLAPPPPPPPPAGPRALPPPPPGPPPPAGKAALPEPVGLRPDGGRSSRCGDVTGASREAPRWRICSSAAAAASATSTLPAPG